MLSREKMKERIKKYDWVLWFDETMRKVYLNFEVKLSYQRALEWIEVGITDFDCRTKEQMIELINSWMEELK